MLVQSSLPDSLSTELYFVSELGKRPDVELLYDWSHPDEIWQKSPNETVCLDSCRKSICTGVEGSKILSFGIEVPGTGSCSNSSAAKDMCSNCASKWDGLVYKRRKLRRNTVTTLLLEEKAAESNVGNSGSDVDIISMSHPPTVQKNPVVTTSLSVIGLPCGQHSNPENSSISGQHPYQEIPCSQIIGAKNSASLQESMQDNELSTNELTAEPSIGNHLKSVPQHCSLLRTSCPSSESDIALDSKNQADCAQCSSSDATFTESLKEFTSTRELCISILRRNGLLGGLNTSRACRSSNVLGVNDANVTRSCKICNILESPLKMLICDLCEDAFHVTCCFPKVGKVPVDYWYCQNCIKKRPKNLLEKTSRRSVKILAEQRYRKCHARGGPILRMLKDDRPYISEVRIGKECQADIPEWPAPISEDSNYFNEQVELDIAEYASLDVQNAEYLYNSTSISNWIQCRAVTYKNSKDKGTLCGKWRRAPLFVVQTSDWDCSCSVIWDPIHADCAVPQELDTYVILKHLKYLEMLRPHLTIQSKQ